MTAGSAPRRCFMILAEPYDEGGYVPALVTEGEPGYGLMAGNRAKFQSPWYWGRDREQAVEIAEQENARMGISGDDAAEIIASSLAAQHARD